MKQTNSEFILVRKGGIHGTGVFARNFIPKGTKILEYVGEKITKSEAYDRIDKIEKKALKNKVPPVLYVFELNKRYDIDGDVPWNTAKWINHSCNPNCETEDDNGRVWIMATKNINAGEELTYDYGFYFDPECFKDSPCKCGSKECIGYIVKKEHWNRLKRHLDKIQAEKREIKNTPLLTIRR